MAVTFTGTKLPQSELAEIQAELYQDSATFRERYVDIQEGHKSGTEVYESKVTVTAKAATAGKVTADATIDLAAQRTPVSLVSIEFSDIVDESTLLDTRFEKSMAAGAFNRISNEFDNAVLQQVTPAIGESIENLVWNGATTAQKALIAGLTPGAGQGSISAGAQTLVAAMPTTYFDSVPATMLYNASNSKAVPGAGLGDYLKVLSIATVTSASIVAEYVKIYNTIPDDVLVKTGDDAPVIFAPKGDYKLIKNANRVQGAALQTNFVGESFNDMYFNDIKIIFVDLVGFRICAPKNNNKLVVDLLSDSSQLIIEKEANASTRRIVKMINSMATWTVLQKWNVLYGG